MSNEQRDDFERRLLALVRDQMDYWDERFTHGWEITDFVVAARGYIAPEPDAPIEAWAGGPYPGWQFNSWTRGSSRSWFSDIEILDDALNTTRQQLADATGKEDAENDQNDQNDES